MSNLENKDGRDGSQGTNHVLYKQISIGYIAFRTLRKVALVISGIRAESCNCNISWLRFLLQKDVFCATITLGYYVEEWSNGFRNSVIKDLGINVMVERF